MHHIAINAQIMTVTPDMAKEWLADRWPEQRAIRGGHVARLLHDMENGNWKIGPDAILRVKGKLANGQHRLEALVRYGKPLRFLVMDSNDDELYKIIDAGMRRLVADGLIGIKYAAKISTIARWILAYEAGIIQPHTKTSGDTTRVSGSNFKSKYLYSQVELINYCTDNSATLSESAEFIDGLYRQSALLRWSIGGALYCMATARGEQAKVKEFLTQLFLGGTTDSAASDLRNRLIMIKGSKAKFSGAYVFAITVKAYKSYLNGTRPNRLTWSKDEDFPTLDAVAKK